MQAAKESFEDERQETEKLRNSLQERDKQIQTLLEEKKDEIEIKRIGGPKTDNDFEAKEAYYMDKIGQLSGALE